MVITTRIYSAKVLDIEIDGNKILGSSIYLQGEDRVPQKIFISNDTSIASNLIDYIKGYDDETNPLVECEVALNGKKVIYKDIRPFTKKK